MAVAFLLRNGVQVIARNVRIARDQVSGEIDIVGLDHGVGVVFEVRSRRRADAMDGFDPSKIAQVATLGRSLDPPVYRVDLIAVDIHPDRVDVRWVPDAW